MHGCPTVGYLESDPHGANPHHHSGTGTEKSRLGSLQQWKGKQAHIFCHVVCLGSGTLANVGQAETLKAPAQ